MHKPYRIFYSIVSYPAFIIVFFFMVYQIAHNFGIDKLKTYLLKSFPVNLQISVAAINVVYVLENCPSFYQPFYVVCVLFAHIILSKLSLDISNKLNGRKVLLLVSFIIPIAGISILAYTMRSYILG